MKEICFNSLLGILKPHPKQYSADIQLQFQFLTRYPKTFRFKLLKYLHPEFQFLTRYPKTETMKLVGQLAPSLFQFLTRYPKTCKFSPISNPLNRGFNSLLGILKPLYDLVV